jgi:hypothetical protein
MTLRALAIVILSAACSPALAGPECDQAAFREAVAAASASITVLHEKNNKVFQEHLQKLRVLQGWRDAEFVAGATPFVKDETTASLDAANQALLAQVQSLEATNAGSESGRCTMLSTLKLSMEKVVANTTAKWEHMLTKIGRATAQPLQAGLAQ